MSEEEFAFLLDKKRREGLDAGNAQRLEAWSAQSPENRQAAAEIEALLEKSESTPPTVDTQAELARLKARLRAEEVSEQPPLVATGGRRAFLHVGWAAAAALALVLCAVFFLKNNPFAGDGLLVVSASEGAVKQVELPDGSVAILRSGAELRYALDLGGGSNSERRVSLRGEAFFEVKKKPARPFVVEAGGCETRVLGTRFNVRALPDAPVTEISVREGRVLVSSRNGSGQAILAPGWQAVFDRKTATIKTEQVETAAVAEWRSPELLFRQTLLRDVAERLSRRFGQTIVLENAGLAESCRYSAFFPQANLDAVLKNLQTVYGLHTEPIPGGGYRLRGGSCPN
ncbi:MAG: FecR domain-containing protein [Saprospiraceae bacterium]